MTITRYGEELADTVDRLADSVDALDNLLEQAPLFGAVRVADTNLRAVVAVLVDITGALVDTVAGHPPRVDVGA